MISSQAVTEIFDSLFDGLILRTFVQYLITFYSWLEASVHVISGRFVGQSIVDKTEIWWYSVKPFICEHRLLPVGSYRRSKNCRKWRLQRLQPGITKIGTYIHNDVVFSRTGYDVADYFRLARDDLCKLGPDFQKARSDDCKIFWSSRGAEGEHVFFSACNFLPVSAGRSFSIFEFSSDWTKIG